MIILYRSNYDEFDTTTNGGDITDIQIESGVLHSFIPAVRPRMAETGGERWFKFFVKTNRNIVTIGIDIAKNTISNDDEVYFANAKTDEFENDLDKDNIRLYGGFKVVDIDNDNKKIKADKDVSEFIKANDTITFYDDDNNRITALIVDSIDEDEITIKEWSNIEIIIGNTGSSTIIVDKLNTNEYFGIWIKQIVKEFAVAMENPADEFICNVWYDFR